MPDVFNSQGQKIGYTDRSGHFHPSQYNTQQNILQNNQPRQQYKKSGATYSVIRDGQFRGFAIVNAWRSTKMGLVTAKVTPYAGQDKGGLKFVESVNEVTGEVKEYQKMLCTITNASLGTQQTYHVLMNTKTGTIVIKELNLCITKNGSGVTRSGKSVKGYFGKNFKSK